MKNCLRKNLDFNALASLLEEGEVTLEGRGSDIRLCLEMNRDELRSVATQVLRWLD